MTEAAAQATNQAAADAGKTADAGKAAAKPDATAAKAEAKPADAGKAVEFKLPDEFKAKDGNPDVSKIVGRLSEYEAERNARGLPPESADKYEFAVPKDLKLPDGSAAEIDPDSPLFTKFRELSFGLKLSQADAQKLFELGVEREFDLLSDVAAKAAGDLAEEKKKLGSKHEERLSNVGNWFKSHFGSEGGSFIETLGKAEQVVMLEKLIAKFGGAGAAGASNRTSSAPNTDDALAKMYPSMVGMRT